MEATEGTFYKCEKCGKNLIVRLSNGLWHFCFGKNSKKRTPMVNMLIQGSIQMHCLGKGCTHITTLHFFPPPVFTQPPLAKRDEETTVVQATPNGLS